MLQIINISQARNNFSRLVEEVSKSKKPIVIVKDSFPSVVIYPYEKLFKEEKIKEMEWNERFKKAIKEGKKFFQQWLKKKGIIQKTLTEEKVYEIIEKI